MDVAAPVGKTWDAVIDEFAARNVPIRAMDRASGFIATDPLSVGRSEAEADADCGTALGVLLRADRATYNVLVRGDSTKSTVKVTARFTFAGHASSLTSRDPNVIECSSAGLWENKAEKSIKARAEGKPPA